MNHSAFHRGRLGALAPAAALLLALCLLAVGVQAMTDPVNSAALALAPYPGSHPVPGVVWAWDYDAGGEGVAYHDTEPANLGGAYRPAEGVDIETAGTSMDVGWIRDGEWLTYTVNATDPLSCTIVVEAANPDPTTKRVAILADGVPAGTVDLRPTGSFSGFTGCESTPIPLPAGETTIRLQFDGVSRVNLHTLDFQPTFVEPTPVPTPASELLIDTPGLHTLDRDLSADVVGVLITSSDVVFDGMGHTIEGTTANATGVCVAPPTSSGTITNVTVRNFTVRDCGAGIAIDGVVGSVVEHVVAEQNTVGFAVNAYGGTGTDYLVRDSVFRENSRAGIELGFQGRGASIERCSITGNGKGVTLDYFQSSDRTRTRIVDSTVSENAGNAISITDISGLLVASCTVRENGGDGVYVEHSRAEIVGCHIENNARIGVESSDRGGSDIHGNWITGNGMGVVVGGDWSSAVRNNYLNNTDNGYFGASTAGLLNYEKTAGENIVGGPFLGGNFWADPNGTGFSQTHPDTNGDGFCDEPFVMEDSTDGLPLAPSPGTPVIVPTPYRQHPVPGRIEAEDYDIGGETIAYHDTTPGNTGGAYRHDDVDIETANGITDVGWIRDGEWLVYTLNVTQEGAYQMTARVATPNDYLSVRVSVNGNEASLIRFPNTGSFTTYTTAVSDPLYLPAGTSTIRLTFNGDGENLDWIAFAPQPPDRTPFQIPCTIQAEDYEPGGYLDTTPGNQGGAYRQDDVDIEVGASGYDVGWIRTGEYLTYEVYIPKDGTYTMTARVASPNSGRTIAVSAFGETLPTIAVPNTGSFSTYRTVSVPVTLTSGFHALKLTFSGDGQNLDWIAFAQAGAGTPTPTPTPSVSTPTPTPEAGGANFVAAPLTAPKGSAVKFTLTPASGKSIGSVLWSFDAPAHLNTWNSRAVSPTFFYPSAGTFSPLVKITYTDGSTETVQRVGYIHAT